MAPAPEFITVDELYFLWDESPSISTYRHAFHGVRASVPILKKFGEASPIDNGCRLVWKFAMEIGCIGLPSFLSGPISAGAFGAVRNDTVKHFVEL